MPLLPPHFLSPFQSLSLTAMNSIKPCGCQAFTWEKGKKNIVSGGLWTHNFKCVVSELAFHHKSKSSLSLFYLYFFLHLSSETKILAWGHILNGSRNEESAEPAGREMCVWAWMCWMNECRSWFIRPREPLSACPAESWWLEPLCKTNPAFSFCCSHHTALAWLESDALHSPKCSDGLKNDHRSLFYGSGSSKVRESYYAVKNSLDYGGGKEWLLKTKGWFIQSSA